MFYWWMGIAATIGLLFSIVFHEMSHSLVARRFDLPIRGITLRVRLRSLRCQASPSACRIRTWLTW